MVKDTSIELFSDDLASRKPTPTGGSAAAVMGAWTQRSLVTVDPTYQIAWRRKLYYVQLLGWAQHMVVAIRVGRRSSVNEDGTEQQETRTEAWLEGREEPGPVISN